ncbi:Rep [uncultured virus]|uniref:Rep n=1 Tax=uncultured virus TaxID=340016 RepID=A0A2K9LS81_9VIRU|nr:Rep [uncultured virus]
MDTVNTEKVSPKKAKFDWKFNRCTFTLNNPTDKEIEEFVKITEDLPSCLKYVCVGAEVGDSGTFHLQGCAVATANAAKCTKKMWSVLPGAEKMYFARMRGTLEQASDYCKKDEQWVEAGVAEGKWKQIYEAAKVDIEAAVAIDYEVGVKHYNQIKSINTAAQNGIPAFDLQLRPWQVTAYNKLLNQNERQILFVVDIDGGKGKSTMARWLLSKPNTWGCRGKLFIPGSRLRSLSLARFERVGRPVTNRGNNKSVYFTGGKLINLACSWTKGTYDVAVFDMARSNDVAYFPWNFVEQLKDGWFLSEKYDSAMRVFKPPKIVMFMNQDPPRDKFTSDRYDVLII